MQPSIKKSLKRRFSAKSRQSRDQSSVGLTTQNDGVLRMSFSGKSQSQDVLKRALPIAIKTINQIAGKIRLPRSRNDV